MKYNLAEFSCDRIAPVITMKWFGEGVWRRMSEFRIGRSISPSHQVHMSGRALR